MRESESCARTELLSGAIYLDINLLFVTRTPRSGRKISNRI